MGDRDGCIMWWGSGGGRGGGSGGGVDFCLPPVSEWVVCELFFRYFNDPMLFLIPIFMMLQPLLKYLVETKYDVCKYHEESCKILMASYDFLMAIFSFSCFIGMSYALSETGVYTRDHFANSKFAFLSYAFYWSRYAQFLDIFFLVLTRRPVSWLQYYQHVGACVVMGLCCLHKADGVWVFVLFNAFIHTMMYLYYGFAIMEWPFRGRQCINFFQLTQIVMGICFVTPHIFDPSIASNHGMMLAYSVYYVYLMLLTVLFVNFSGKTYSGEKKVVGVSGDSKFVFGPMGSIVIHYRGLAIDVTDWQFDHPGGSKVLKIVHERDCTDAVMASHSSATIKRIESLALEKGVPVKRKEDVESEVLNTGMENIRHNGKKNDKRAEVREKNVKFFPLTQPQSDMKWLRDYAEERNLFDYEFDIISNVSTWGFFFYGIASLISEGGGVDCPSSSSSYQFGWLYLGIGWYLLGWLAHDFAHHAGYETESDIKISNVWAWMCAAARGNSLLWWKLRHNAHHVALNDPDRDPDIRLHGFFHFYEEFDPNKIQIWQHLYYVPFVTLLHFYWTWESYVVVIKNIGILPISRKINKHAKVSARRDMLGLAGHLVFIIVLGRWCGFMKLIYAKYLSGFLTGLVVFGSHYAERRIEDAKDEKKTAVSSSSTSESSELTNNNNNNKFEDGRHDNDFVHRVFESTRNIGGVLPNNADGHLWFYLTGALNLQIEHHLFPRMPRNNLPKVVGAVKELAKKRGYEYMESSLYETTRKAVLALQDNTIRNLYRAHDLKQENTRKSHLTSDKCKVDHEMSDIVLSYQKEFAEKIKFANAKCAFGAIRILCKAVALSLLGVIITSSGGLSSFLVPVGVFLTCIGYCGLDVIRAESQAMRFFPSDRINRLISFAFSLISWKMFPLISLFVYVFCDEAWTKYFTLPVLLMRIQMLELQWKESENLVGKGLCGGGAASLLCPELLEIANVLNGFAQKKCPIVSFESIPMYHVTRISHELKIVLSDLMNKNGLNFGELERDSIGGLNNVRAHSKFVGSLLLPIRYSFQQMFLWEKRDYVFFALAFWFCADIYFSVSVSLIPSFVKVIFPLADVHNNISLIPLCLILPLFIAAPKASCYVRIIRKTSKISEIDENESELCVVSPGDSESTIRKWQEISKVPSKKEILDAVIPFEKKNMFYAFYYAFRDIAFCCLFFSVAYYTILPLEDVLYDYFTDLASSWSISFSFFSSFFMVSYYFIIWSLWILHAWFQGLAGAGIWVLGHECGHGAFSDNRFVNNIVGYILHTAVLVPYFSWQCTHAKHHKFTNHLIQGETHVPGKIFYFTGIPHRFIQSFPMLLSMAILVIGWPLYMVTNLTGGRVNAKNERMNKHKNRNHFIPSSQILPESLYFYALISTLGVVAVLSSLFYLGIVFSFTLVFKFYFMPYLVTNGWLVMYTWLHHSHEDVPHFGLDIDINDPNYSWLRGSLCTIDRPYPWYANFMHHEIGSNHLVHHLSYRIPHYNLKAATKVVKPILGPLYRYDPRPVSVVLSSLAVNCATVRSMSGVQFLCDLMGRSSQQRMDGEKGMKEVNK